jgi:DHA1 family multidrug resistance protein-like MFS transporter
MKALLSHGSVLSIVGMMFFYAISMTIQRPQLPLLVKEIVVTEQKLATQAGMVLSVGGLASVIAGMLFGTLADRGKTYALGSLCAVVGSGFVAVMALAGSVWHVAGLNFLFAMAAGGVDPILKTILTHHVPPEQRGSAFGLIGSSRAFGWFFGALIGGVLASILGLRPIFLISAALFVIIAGLLALLGRRSN